MQDNSKNQLTHPLNGYVEQRIIKDLLMLLNSKEIPKNEINSRVIELASKLKNNDYTFLSCFDEIPEARPNSIISLFCFAKEWDAAKELLTEPTQSIGSALLSMIYIIKPDLQDDIARALPLIEMIITHPNFDVNFTNTKGETALYLACKLNAIDIVKLLLKIKNIDINLQEKTNGNTPLMIAITARNFEIALKLFRHKGLLFNKRNAKKETAIELFNWTITQSVLSNEVYEHERYPLLKIMKALTSEYSDFSSHKNCLDENKRKLVTVNDENQNPLAIHEPSNSVNGINIIRKKALNDFLSTVDKQKKIEKNLQESISRFETIINENLIENTFAEIGELANKIKENSQIVPKKNRNARLQINTKATQAYNKATKILANYKKTLIPISTAFNASTDTLSRAYKTSGKALEQLQKAYDDFTEKNAIFNEKYNIIKADIEKQLSVILDLKATLAKLLHPVNTKKPVRQNRTILQQKIAHNKPDDSLSDNPSCIVEEISDLNNISDSALELNTQQALVPVENNELIEEINIIELVGFQLPEKLFIESIGELFSAESMLPNLAYAEPLEIKQRIKTSAHASFFNAPKEKFSFYSEIKDKIKEPGFDFFGL